MSEGFADLAEGRRERHPSPNASTRWPSIPRVRRVNESHDSAWRAASRRSTAGSSRGSRRGRAPTWSSSTRAVGLARLGPAVRRVLEDLPRPAPRLPRVRPIEPTGAGEALLARRRPRGGDERCRCRSGCAHRELDGRSGGDRFRARASLASLGARTGGPRALRVRGDTGGGVGVGGGVRRRRARDRGGGPRRRLRACRGASAAVAVGAAGDGRSRGSSDPADRVRQHPRAHDGRER